MRSTKTLGAALLALLALGAMLASAASANEWRDNGGTIVQPKSVTYAPEVEFLIASTERVVCNLTTTSTVGPGAVGEITSIKSSSGKSPVLCEQRGNPGLCEPRAEEVEAIHLPWATELTTVEGQIEDIIKSSGHGTPGWKIKCTTSAFGKMTRECEIAMPMTVSNQTGGVSSSFIQKTERCFEPFFGYESVRFGGGGVIKLTEAGTLSVK